MKKKLLVLLCACCCIVCILINQPIVYIVFAIAVVLAALNLFVFNRNRLDRKSTRLNSSHTVISYAVFCLKKIFF